MKRTIVWRVLAAASMVAAVAPGAAALDKVRISAVRRTASQHEGSSQQLPRTSTRATRSDVFYRIGLQRMSTEVPEEVEVEWLLVVERMGGRLVPEAHGVVPVKLPFGQEIEMDTDTVTLLGREFGGGSRGVEDDLYGYAVRVRVPDGSIVAEKYYPKGLEQQVEGIIEEWNKTRNQPTRIPPALLPRRRLFR